MLLRNNDAVIRIDSSTAEATLFREALKELENYATNDMVVFVLTDAYKKVASVPLDLQAHMPGGEIKGKRYGSYSIRYYEVEKMDSKGRKLFEPVRYEFFGRLPLNLKQQPELAYFLYACSPHCQNGPNANDKIPSYFRLENKVIEAKTRNEDRKQRNIIETMIMQPFENGGMAEEDLRKFAKSIFIQSAGKIDIEILRDRVYSAVIEKDMHDKFLDNIKYEDREEAKVLASDLVTYNIVKSFDDKGTKVWRFIEEEGRPGERIIKIPTKSVAMHILAEKLFKDKDLKKEAESRLKEVLQTEST